METQHDITEALLAVDAGDQDAAERLWCQVYDHLCMISHRELQKERQNRTLSTQALVHEAYAKLIDHTRISWQNRAHFYQPFGRTDRKLCHRTVRLIRPSVLLPVGFGARCPHVWQSCRGIGRGRGLLSTS
jgi:hypothetical protein